MTTIETARALMAATDVDEAERAYRALDVFDRRLFPSAPAVAACLVRGLEEAADFAEERALEILVEMSGSIPEGPDERPGDHALYRECMAEVVRGFPAYVRTLRSGTSLSARLVCVDLILMCGLHDEGMRAAAIRSLEEASRYPEFSAHSRLLADSVEGLKEQQ